MSALLTLAEAQQRALALAPHMPAVEIETAKASGKYLATDLIARRSQPSADLSAMDGYAIAGGGPWHVVGESRAGTPFNGSIESGQAVKISTGAHMPLGSDRVLIRENASCSGDTLTCTDDMPHAGKHVRLSGFDFNNAERVLKAGTRLGAQQIALAIAAGHSTLSIRSVPTIAVIDTGDELAADATNCGPDQIPASNGAMLSAMLEQIGCDVTRLGPIADDRKAILDALQLTENADIVITTGGASVGDHDLIHPALEEWGAKLDFWKVAMKPGKPLMVAQRDKQAFFGLPGNPVSSFVTAFLFVLPCVKAAMGSVTPLPLSMRMIAGCDLSASGTRHEFLRGYWNGSVVKLADSQDSSALRALANSNCLIERPIGALPVVAGDPVDCYLLETA